VKTVKLKTVAEAILAVFLLVSAWIALTPCPNVHLSSVPSYVESMWPSTESETPLGCYIRRYLFIRPFGGGVGARIDTNSVRELETSPAYTEKTMSLADRISLYADGEQVPITGWTATGGLAYAEVDGKTVEVDEEYWRYVSSSHFMGPGSHRAKVVIITTPGKTLEYEWHFEITWW
jgi:hypothetical protein